MTTLKDLWEEKRLSPTELAGIAGISTPTLYRMARKERTHRNNVRAVCKALNISERDYELLESVEAEK